MIYREHFLRTTLTIDDDVLTATREMAAAQNKTLGAMLSSLARQTLLSSLTSRSDNHRNGVPLLAFRPNSPRITSEMIRQFLEELP